MTISKKKKPPRLSIKITGALHPAKLQVGYTGDFAEVIFHLPPRRPCIAEVAEAPF
jgi:hypothetical protein